MEILSQLQQLLGSSLTEVGQAITAYLPRLFTALLLLLLGWGLARLSQGFIRRFGQGVDRLTAWLHHQAVPTAAPLANSPSMILARIIYWLVLLLFATAAAESLGLPGFTDWVGRFMQYLPNLFSCIIIIVVGVLLAGLVPGVITRMALAQGYGSAQLLGRSVQLLIIVIAVLLGIGNLGVNIRLLVNLITLAAASVLGGLGLAFGLGARQQVSNIIAAQSLQSLYQPGQRIRIQDIEGEIIAFTSKAVLVKTSAGQAAIPAALFSEQVTLLIEERADD
ncbi:MAG: small-conductance mechanosensitive channel [Motiliproteus sp.]|jgi:small-conductance mechanosensitive channel